MVCKESPLTLHHISLSDSDKHSMPLMLSVGHVRSTLRGVFWTWASFHELRQVVVQWQKVFVK